MDIDKIREQTPHCKDRIFLNSAGSSLMSRSVKEKITGYLEDEYRLGGYKVAELREGELNGYYRQLAKLLNCAERNIAFAHDATDAYFTALSSIPFQAGDVIITTDDDYNSNHFNFIALRDRFGVKIRRMRNLENGDLDLDHFRGMVDKYLPKVVAVTHIPTNSGLVQDVEAIGQICSGYPLIYLVDACQSVGQIPVDVKKIKCDFLTATGRKWLRGPRGTGLLYISDRLLEKSYHPFYLDGRGATWTAPEEFEIIEGGRRFETWESPFALKLGLAEAVRICNSLGIDHIYKYNNQLIERLRSNLSGIEGLQTYDRGSSNCNILTFRKKGVKLEEIKKVLDQNEVYYSVSHREWGLIDFDKKGINWAIRLSPHYFNTMEEMDRVAEMLQ